MAPPDGNDRDGGAAEQVMMLALPNTGTDWLADLWLRQGPGLRYYREFFNPICNPKYEDVLNRAFGCEMADNYALLARPGCPCDEVYAQTWAREDYNFTKENYSAFKVGAFADKFRCFVLYRKAEASLPGGRLPVKTWFDAMYASLAVNRAALEPDVRLLFGHAAVAADTINKRQVAAFVIYYYQLLKEARRRRLPVLDYDVLMSRSAAELVPYLRGLPGVVDPERLAQDVCATRRPAAKDFAALRAGALYERLTDLAARCGGAGVFPPGCAAA
jgi:hypothetical protein